MSYSNQLELNKISYFQKDIMFAENKMELPTPNQLIKINEISSLKISFKAIIFSINESNNQSKNAVKVLAQLYDAIQGMLDISLAFL